MFYLHHLIKLQHFGSKHLGVHRLNIVCLHRNDPIIFVVIFKPLLKTKTFFGQNIISCLFEPIDNAFQNMQVHNVNMKVIINNVKIILIDEWWWGFHNATWTFITASYTTYIVATLIGLTNTFSTFDKSLTMFEVVKSKKLKLIMSTFLTTLKGWSFLLTITQQKPYTLPTTRNLNSIFHHTQKTLKRNTKD